MMLCDNCAHFTGDGASSNPEDARPYPEVYCAKGHWSGLDPSEPAPKNDPWAGCKDYAVPCPYCGGVAALISGRTLYPHRPDLSGLKFWACAPCDAWVGCHEQSQDHKPLGRLANAELRQWKKKAHAVFDPIWKSGRMKRKEAYRYLQDLLKAERKPHIGFMDVAECKRVVFLIAGKSA